MVIWAAVNLVLMWRLGGYDQGEPNLPRILSAKVPLWPFDLLAWGALFLCGLFLLRRSRLAVPTAFLHLGASLVGVWGHVDQAAWGRVVPPKVLPVFVGFWGGAVILSVVLVLWTLRLARRSTLT
ncbi:MAG: hypothetical protein AB7U46_02845 [Paenirhodobacter sp.]